MSKEDPYNLDLELPSGRDFVSVPPKLTLEEYEAWCEEYWASAGESKRNRVMQELEEFTM